MAATIPEQVLEEAAEQLAKRGDYDLSSSTRGNYLYIYAQGEPLCRFKYVGDPREWEFGSPDSFRPRIITDQTRIREQWP